MFAQKPLFEVDKNKVPLSKKSFYFVQPQNIRLRHEKISRFSCLNTIARISVPLFFIKKNLQIFCKKKILDPVETSYVVKALILKIVGLALANASRVIVITSPYIDFLQGHSLFGGIIRRTSIRYNHVYPFEFHDFLKTIKSKNWDTKKMYLDGLHYTASGNKKLAFTLAEWIS
tara:strand:- start:95 stop:616 length:522 start_codon:yes stop_codon:yes gene_type:complete